MIVDVLLREYQGYTYGTLMQDIEDYEDFLGGALACISARHKVEDEAHTGGKLEREDIGTERGQQWAKARSAHGDRTMSGAHSALAQKFPGMM